MRDTVYCVLVCGRQVNAAWVRADDLLDIHFFNNRQVKPSNSFMRDCVRWKNLSWKDTEKNPASDLATRPPSKDRSFPPCSARGNPRQARFPLHIAAEGYLFIHGKSSCPFAEVLSYEFWVLSCLAQYEM